MAISSSVDSSFSSNNIVRSGRTSEPAATLSRTDMLDCRVCFEPLSIPIYQCIKGHNSCSRCREDIQNHCPTCCLPVDVRNNALEEVLEAVKIICPNSKYGCKEKLVRYSMKGKHMRSCAYEPCYCPFPGCGFDGSYKDLYLHFSSKHPTSATRFTFDSSFSVHVSENTKYKFLQGDDGTLFVLNCGRVQTIRTIGRVADIICIGPNCLEKEYSYELQARCGNTPVKFSTSLMPRLPKWTEDLPVKAGPVVPKVFFDSSFNHNIQVCICRKGENSLESSSASS